MEESDPIMQAPEDSKGDAANGAGTWAAIPDKEEEPEAGDEPEAGGKPEAGDEFETGGEPETGNESGTEGEPETGDELETGGEPESGENGNNPEIEEGEKPGTGEAAGPDGSNQPDNSQKPEEDRTESGGSPESGENQPGAGDQPEQGEQPGEEDGQEKDEESVPVYSWEWIDDEELLIWSQELGQWCLGLPGASEENPVTAEALAEMLPGEITARLEADQTKVLPLVWDFSGYPEEGAWEGSYTLPAEITGGYLQSEDIPPISVLVVLGDGQIYADKIVTGWSWVDEERQLCQDAATGEWSLTVHVNAHKKQAEVEEILKGILPGKIRLELQDGTEETIETSWTFPDFQLPWDAGINANGTIVGWNWNPHLSFHAELNLQTGYGLETGGQKPEIGLELYTPKKFLNQWTFVAKEGTEITGSDGIYSMDVFPLDMSPDHVKEALEKVLPEKIHSGFGAFKANERLEYESNDFIWKGPITADATEGYLKISWPLYQVDQMEFQDGETYTIQAVYNNYWGVNNPGDKLINTYLNLQVTMHFLNLDYHTVTDGVINPEGTTVNLFDYWVYEKGKQENLSEATEGDILSKSDSHYRSENPEDVNNYTEFSTVGDWNQGINVGHLLLFGDGMIHAGLWNKGAGQNSVFGNTYAGMESIVRNKLADGYPVINTELAREILSSDDRNCELVKDYKLVGDHNDAYGKDYNSDNIQNLSNGLIKLWEDSRGQQIENGTESLDYLFDPGISHPNKETYTNVTGLFQVDEDGYYYYDMRENFAQFVKDSKGNSDGHFVLYDAPATLRTDGDKSVGNFFPFNTGEQVFTGVADGKLTSAVDCERNEMNHHLGMTVDVQFRQPVNGMISMGSNSKPMTFEFAGDDDVWVFIDDVLVLDLGGVHSEIYGTIDFSTGDVFIGRAFDTKGIPEHPEDPANMVTHTSLRELFRQAGEEDGRAWSGDTFASNSDHVLRMFYLERGNYDSSIALRFNLQPRLYQEMKKIDQNGSPIEGVEFELYAAQKSGEGDQAVYTAAGAPLAHLKSDGDGRDRFEETGENGEPKPFNFADRYEDQGIQYYVMKETKTPDGYRTPPVDVVLEYDPDTTMLTVVNRWITGAFSSFTATIAGSRSLTYGAFNPATGKIEPSDRPVAIETRREGLVVAIPFLYQQEIGKWRALYGNNMEGLHSVEPEDREVVAWRKAALTAVLYQCADNGPNAPHWFLEWDGEANRLTGVLSDLPGSAERYQLGDTEGDMKIIYAVIDPAVFDALGIDKTGSGEQYEKIGAYVRSLAVNRKSLDQAVEEAVEQIYHIRGDGLDSGFHFLNVDEFIQNFRSQINIPNEQRELRVWKVDQDGNGINGAVFALFREADCSGTPVAQGTTAHVGDRDGVLVFAPKDGGRTGYAKMEWASSQNTRYYLKEIAAPPGHEINDTIVPVIVGIYSIYADAGREGDDITVMAGVGKLAQTMTQYAADEEVDITLRDITAYAQVQESGSFDLYGWKDLELTGVPVRRRMYLHYGMNAMVDYGLHNEDGGSNIYAAFVTDTGFLRTRVQQNYPALTGEMYGSSTIYTNKQNLGNTDITTLFSLLNIVVVTDRTEADTRTGQLTIEKMVEGEDLTEKDYLHNFEFQVRLTDANGRDLPGDYYFYGSDKSGYVASGGTIPLHHDDSVTILGLPQGTHYHVTELEGWTGYRVIATGEDGFIEKDEEQEALFLNTKTDPKEPEKPEEPENPEDPGHTKDPENPKNPDVPSNPANPTNPSDPGGAKEGPESEQHGVQTAGTGDQMPLEQSLLTLGAALAGILALLYGKKRFHG